MNRDIVAKVADKVNAKRRKEVLNIYRNGAVFDFIKKARKSEVYQEGKKGGVRMRKVATVPTEVDVFFSRIYGNDYYKDPDFFTKKHQEWRVVDPNIFGNEEDNILKIAQGFSDD